MENEKYDNLRDASLSMPVKLNNNYLKMHGKRTIRRKALALYKRRHHSE